MKLVFFTGTVYAGSFLGGIWLISANQDIGWAVVIISQIMLTLAAFLLGTQGLKKTMMDTADIIIRGQVVNDQADVAKTKAMAGLVNTAYKQAAIHYRNQASVEIQTPATWDDILPGDFKLLDIGDDNV